MYVEAFTQAKDPRAPETNDDRLLVHESRVFAVLDGVTDKSGAALEGGLSRGQAAGRVLDARLRELSNAGAFESGTTAELVASLTEALRDEYVRRGILEAVLADPNLRFAAQLAVAAVTPLGWRVLVVGDCGARVRLRGAPPVLIATTTPHDDITAIWRALVVSRALRRGAEPAAALAVGRTYALAGNSRFLPEHADHLSAADHAELAPRAVSAALAAHAALTAEAITAVLGAGLLELGRYRNAGAPLGFTCLDGTAIPVASVHDLVFDQADVLGIELFSDGYFGPPRDGDPTVAAWERHFQHVEATDPLKIAQFRSTKGSVGGRSTDDRTVLIVTPEVGE